MDSICICRSYFENPPPKENNKLLGALIKKRVLSLVACLYDDEKFNRNITNIICKTTRLNLLQFKQYSTLFCEVTTSGNSFIERLLVSAYLTCTFMDIGVRQFFAEGGGGGR